MRLSTGDSLRGRLTALYLLTVIVLGISWLVAVLAMSSMHGSFAVVVQRDDQLADTVGAMTKDMLDQETGWRAYVLTADPLFLQPYQAGRQALSAAADQARRFIDDAPTEALLTAALRAAAAWQAYALAGIHAIGQGHRARVMSVSMQEQGKALFDAYRGVTTRLTNVLSSRRAAALRDSETLFARVNILFGALAVGFLLLISLLGWRLMRTLLGALDALQVAAQRIQQGDLSGVVPARGPAEVATLGRALDAMRAHLSVRSRLADLLASTLDLDLIYPTFAGLLREVVPFDRVSVTVPAPDGGLVIAFTIGDAQAVPRGTTLPPTGFTDQAFHGRRPVILADLATLPLEQHTAATRSLRDQGLHAVLALPLLTHGQATGMLLLASRQPACYTDAMALQLGSLVQPLASALANARLYLEVQATNTALEQASTAKSAFLATMSHELRTPLNAIIGFSEVLQDQTFGLLAPRQQRYVGNILDSGRHLLGLINDVLDLSKVEAGKMEVHLEELPLGEALRETYEQMLPLAQQKQIDLHLVTPDAAVRVLADRVRLRQILYNLLSNALKFTSAGGQVTVRAALTTAAVEIGVQDTGIGIAPADQVRIFEEFSQVDGALSRTQQGTGLGLALTRRLVALQGGTLTLESSLGAGSTFRVTLPRAAPMMAEAEGAGPLVLALEDDPATCELLSAVLSAVGYRVTCLTHPAEMLNAARTLRPRVIILDLVLHGEVVWSVLQDLKVDPDTGTVPVVITSVLEEQATGFALGASAYLTKPVSRRELLEAVERVAGPATHPTVRV